jgi:predicted amidohydrolase
MGDIKRYMRLAASKNAKIVCFPEHSLYASPKRNVQLLAEVCETCKKLGIWCIVGGKLREGKSLYNMAVLIDNNGSIVGRHKKVHLCDCGVSESGSSFEIYKTPFCNIGIAICWDISHPDALFSMAKKGADLIFCPLYWLYDSWAHRKNHREFERRILQSLILSRAFENLAYVAFCGAYNSDQKDIVPYSAIAEPHKRIKELFGKEGMIVGEIDLAYLKGIRKRYEKWYGKRF